MNQALSVPVYCQQEPQFGDQQAATELSVERRRQADGVPGGVDHRDVRGLARLGDRAAGPGPDG